MSPGDVVGERFVIERAAGVGACGAVHRATDRITGAAVAIKTLHDPQATRTDRFAREAAILARLEHPGIVGLVAHGTHLGSPWIAMEWLEGETLAERLARGPLAIGEAIEVTRRAAEILGAAHALGVVHRDLKPSNIFLEAGDLTRVRVIDFGLARRLTDESRDVTKTGAFLGTLAFVAPEQAFGARDVDARADVYSLGCVLFRCVTGENPFPPRELARALTTLLTDDPPRLAELVPGVSAALDDLVAHALSRRPERRPGDGAALARLLAAIATAIPATAAGGTDAPFARGRRIDVVPDESAASDAEPPFVGRDRELATLLGLAARAVEDGTECVAVLRGPPGIGRSRLAAEVAARGSPLLRVLRLDPRDEAPASVDLEIRLGPLSDRAATELADALAPGLPDAVRARLLELGAGNPGQLVALARAASRGADLEEPPLQLLAPFQPRIDALASSERAVLRAASVFALPFDAAAVARVVGVSASAEIGARLATLAAGGWLDRTGSTFRFREPLARHAVLATLTATDWLLATRRAGSRR